MGVELKEELLQSSFLGKPQVGSLDFFLSISSPLRHGFMMKDSFFHAPEATQRTVPIWIEADNCVFISGLNHPNNNFLILTFCFIGRINVLDGLKTV